MHLEVRLGQQSGQWYVRLVGGNGEVMMSSETYYDKSNAMRAANYIAELINANGRPPVEVLVDERT